MSVRADSSDPRPPEPDGAAEAARRDALTNLSVVLVEPQDLVNIAAVIRAMKNFGVGQLRLVDPAEWDPWRIEGIAHRTADLVEAARHFDSLEDAVADSVYVLGTTARARTAGRNYVRPRKVAPHLVERALEGPVSVVFGREDRGLSNEHLDLCHGVAIIPTDPDHSSLNLAQACLVVLYEVFLAALRDPEPLPKGKRATDPVTAEELEAMYGALRSGLEAIEFFKAREPEVVLRTIRTILGRSELDQRESRLIAAIGYEIGNYLGRLADSSESS